MQRREFHAALAAALTAAIATAPAQTARAARPPAAEPDHDMSSMPAHWMGNEQIAMLVYPEFTALDLVGPQYMFASLMGATVHLVGASREPVRSDTGLVFVPSVTFEECPRELDILFVPGGSRGTLAAIRDEATRTFLADRGARAKRVTSVCTGSLLLGAAGLLQGYRATSHWVTRDLLPLVGARPVNARVVKDRNRITGAGVTAGLDFGLAIVEQLRDREYAQSVQLLAEYAPAPHLNAGRPETAPARVRHMMRGMFTDFLDKTRAALGPGGGAGR
jgi:putative intracellular protease/amidase